MRHPKSLCDERVPSHDYLSAFLVSISSVAFWLCYLTSIFCSVFVNSMISILLLNAYLKSLFFFFFFSCSVHSKPLCRLQIVPESKVQKCWKVSNIVRIFSLVKERKLSYWCLDQHRGESLLCLHLFRCLENFEERERELFLLQNPDILTCVFFVLSNYWGG